MEDTKMWLHGLFRNYILAGYIRNLWKNCWILISQVLVQSFI